MAPEPVATLALVKPRIQPLGIVESLAPAMAAGASKAHYLGEFAAGCMPGENALGIYKDSHGDWRVHIWRDDWGPYPTAESAAAELYRLAGDNRMQEENWLKVVRFVRCVLWRGIILLIAAALVTM